LKNGRIGTIRLVFVCGRGRDAVGSVAVFLRVGLGLVEKRGQLTERDTGWGEVAWEML
jgi:hypothetical protein